MEVSKSRGKVSERIKGHMVSHPLQRGLGNGQTRAIVDSLISILESTRAPVTLKQLQLLDTKAPPRHLTCDIQY
jgi:hypothetical protein